MKFINLNTIGLVCIDTDNRRRSSFNRKERKVKPPRAQSSFFSPRPPRNLCNLRGSSLAAKSTRPEHSHVLQLSRHLQEKQHRPSVVVEIGDGQHPIHTCQRFQRTTAAIYQQRANLKRWGWWGGYISVFKSACCNNRSPA